MRWNHHDIGSRAIHRILFDPVCDCFPSSDAALSLDVVGTIINNQQRHLDISNHLFKSGFAGLDVAVAEKCLGGGDDYFAFAEWQEPDLFAFPA